MLLNTYQNKKIEEAVKNANPDNESVVIEEGRLISTSDPIFKDGDRLIRAQFYAPRKNVLGNNYSTYWVNICVIWLMSLTLWITLYFDVFRKMLRFFSNVSLLQFKNKE